MVKQTKTPRELVAERAAKYVKENGLVEIKVKAGDFMGNQRCYQNTRQRMKYYNSVAAICILFLPDGRGANLHFVNKNWLGQYVDNTLGYQAEYGEYYLIQEYTRVELDNYSMDWLIYPQIVDDYQDMFLNAWFTKKELKKYKIERMHF